MKKGFTLIELLIVMVVLGVLVTVALPKYRASMERGRSIEGINNLRSASDHANALYIMQGNSYPTDYSHKSLIGEDLTKNIHFNGVIVSEISATTVKFKTTRPDLYTLTAENKDGELLRITCDPVSDPSECTNIGMEDSGGILMMKFAK